MSRERCQRGHFLPTNSTGYRLREEPEAKQTLTWWIPHVHQEMLVRVLPVLPESAELVPYWVCATCRLAVAGTDTTTLGAWRKAQEGKERSKSA